MASERNNISSEKETKRDDVVKKNRSDKSEEGKNYVSQSKTAEEGEEEKINSPPTLPPTWINRIRRRSSRTAKIEEEDEGFEKAEKKLTDFKRSHSTPDAGCPVNQIQKPRRKSSQIDHLLAEPDIQPQQSLPRRLLRRASSLLQEKLDAVSDAAVNYAEESYATANDPETVCYRTPEERFLLHQLNGGDIVT